MPPDYGQGYDLAVEEPSLTAVLAEFGGSHEPSTDVMAHLTSIVVPPLVRSDFQDFADTEAIRFIIDLVSDEELRLIEQQDQRYLDDLRAQQGALTSLTDISVFERIAYDLSRSARGRDEDTNQDAYRQVLETAQRDLPQFEYMLPIAAFAVMSPLLLLGGPSRPHIATDMLTLTTGADREQVQNEARELVGTGSGEITPLDIAYYWGRSYYVLQEDPNPLDPTVIVTDHEEAWQPGTVYSRGRLSKWLRAKFIPSHELPGQAAALIERYRGRNGM